MAKIQLKLDTRKSSMKQNDSFPIVLVLSHNSKTRLISLKYSLTPNQWDKNNLTPIDIPNCKHIGAKLRSQLSKAELLLYSLQLELDHLTMTELKAMVQAEVYSSETTSPKSKEHYIARRVNTASLTDYANQKVIRLLSAGRLGSAEAVKTSMTALNRFINKESIPFTDINVITLKNYTAFCYGRGNKPNTIGACLRQVRALFNEAINEDLIEEKLYPFRKFKIPRSPKTKNRALRLHEIEEIRKLELKHGSALCNARNYFLFMFNNMGINFIDLVKLKKSQFSKTEYDKLGNLIAGRISYERSKTQGSFSIKLTNESISVLNQYDVSSKVSSEYIFPFGFENTEQGRERYKQQRKRVNRKLKELAKLAKIDEELTTYFARHSWATIAKRKMVPITLISEGLGHADLKTTQIYLGSFDDDVLDDANESIVQ
ncbi:MAG: integrase/recombinase XerD [Crocinitomicaceae bacterium]|jgi:integrase/recombinase XerD